MPRVHGAKALITQNATSPIDCLVTIAVNGHDGRKLGRRQQRVAVGR